MHHAFLRPLGTLILLAAGFAFAQDASPAVPHTFEGGDVIRADEMNENFDALEQAIGSIDSDTGLPEGCEVGEALTWNGTEWECSSPQPSYVVVQETSAFDSSTQKTLHANCPTGTTAIGGGAEIFPSLGDDNRDQAPLAIQSTGPSGYDPGDPNDAPVSWWARAAEMSAYSFSWHLTVKAVCAG